MNCHLPTFPHHRSPHSRGSSLVITLAFLVILTILVIGINETTRMDRTSSNLYVERTSAALFSQNAIESVIAKLQQATADVNRHWLSQPGQIVVGAEQDDGNAANGDSRKILTGAKKPDENPGPTDARIIYLHSWVANQTSYPGQEFLNPPNLNVATFQDTTTLLITDRKDSSGAEPQMIVRWNYVRKDGTVDTSEPPKLTDQNNPIIGRYAYWADDESAKINYNLAWKRDYSTSTVSGTLPIGHPSRVALSALDTFSTQPVLADKLHAFLTADNYTSIANGLFNSPAEARQVGADVAAALKANKFEVTHFNHDPDTTFFNEQRIVLTTKAANASGRPYLKVLTNESNDPGTVANVDQTKLNETLFGPGGTAISPTTPGLVYYLSRTDWPMVNGTSSIQSKYFGGDRTQLVQFAINIIDYVRSAESSQSIVEPIRGIIKNGQFLGDWLNVNSNYRGEEGTFKGLTRAPLITEMGMIVSTNTSSYQSKMFVEVYLPTAYGIPSVNLVNDFRYYFQISKGATRYAEAFDANGVDPFTISAASNIVGGNPVLTAGNRAVLSKTLYFNTSGTSTLCPAVSDTVSLRAAICSGNAASDPSIRKYSIIEVAPIGDPVQADPDTHVKPKGNAFIVPAKAAVGSYTVPGTPSTMSVQTDDPRVSGIGNDWAYKTATWGSANPVAAPLSGSNIPEQDADSSGNISQASLYMPGAKGSASNPNGVVSSAGELGYIHTGMQVTTTGSAGVPWRTVRLQPSRLASSIVPDWAFMDLFTAPITVNSMAKQVFAPHDTATGGRVNVNAWAEPATSGTAPFGGQRILPLEAVLLGVRNNSTDSTKTLSSGSAAVIANNIYNRLPATNGKLFGYTSGYFSQGEVVEIQGVADQGEASEETVRQIANLVTARGNVFSIYTIGQALKQTPQGKLVVTAENRQQTMIERYLDSSTNKVRFKTVYSRPLTP